LRMSLQGKIALVTGASRGIGRGIALQLGQAGAKVYITGRKPQESLSSQHSDLPSLEKTANEIDARGGKAVIIYTDHSDMTQVKSLFEQIEHENEGNLDILVNNAYAAVQTISSSGNKTFFEQEPEVWDIVNNVGLRNHYYCCVYAARLMTKRQPSRGIIINVSSIGGLRYLFNVPYGVGKEAIDRMSADMAIELDPFRVTVISLWPGAVKTELITKIADSNELNFKRSTEVTEEATQKIFLSGESIEFSGKAIVALCTDQKVHRFTGKILMTGDLGEAYGFSDVDGRHIMSPRSLKFALTNDVVKFPGSQTLAYWMPNCIKVPGWLMSAACTRL
jgi:dehydrogenase/reductase SDR family protein 1